jgi:general secretion pathway protein E
MALERIQALIREAADRGASDLTFEPEADGGLAVLARIDGVRLPMARLPAADAARAIARLKSLAGLPSYISDEAQDGRIDRSQGVVGDLRLSVLPTVRGERVAIRLPACGELPAPAALGFPAAAVRELQRLVRRPDGLLILAGPTGSGKTTTLHSLITDLIATRDDRHVLMIEDPVERQLAGTTQVEIASHRGFGFSEALAAALRHDPDVIVVGEIRDPATALASVRAALTGHLVLSTVHASRAADVVPRLCEMGVDPALLMPALHGVAAQRLVRRRHADCRGEGCAGCHRGWSGRRGIIDLMLLDQQNRDRLRARQAPQLLADLDLQAAALVAEGATSAAEIARVLA